MDKVERIISLYESYSGRKVIPKHTDPKKTYQYRYASKFLKNIGNVDWDTAKKIVYYAVEYARENSNKTIWTRGLWILTKSNIVDIAYDKVLNHEKSRDLDLQKITESKKFVENNKYKLTDSISDGAYPNIVLWYDTNKICLTYLAMSESCRKAIMLLDEIDKKILPSPKEITRRRIKCMIDKEYKMKVKSILGNDYIKLV